MLPVVALVGRPNVGKSTLFNRLTRSRDAIVADFPGLTRDRQYGQGRVGPRPYIVVDTGGFEPVKSEGIVKEMAGQAESAIAEADIVIFVCDARTGLTPHDERIARRLRTAERPIYLAVNKSEGLETLHVAEFHELGLGDPIRISAAHGQGVNALMDLVMEDFAKAHPEEEAEPEEPEDPDAPKRIKVTVIKTLQAIEQSNVVVLVVDAADGISGNDAHIAGYAMESGRALVVAVNKWDAVDSYKKSMVDLDIGRKFAFLRWARFIHISALKRNGLNHLMKAVTDAHAAAFAKLATPKLTRALIEAVTVQQPPRNGRIRPKMRYAHQGGMNPPVVVIHGNSLQAVGESYRRYLEGWFREKFDLAGTPLRIEFKTSRNPYAEDAKK